MIGPLIGHLGDKASALLDGQLPEDETERAWAHVHSCHACRDLVEREGWVKTRLAGVFATQAPGAPDGLKGFLLHAYPDDAEAYLTLGPDPRARRNVGLAAIGGGAVGAAMMGMLALGAAPASAPTVERRAPATISSPTPAVLVGPVRRDPDR